jgi:Arc/MetJ-type ribon-helix-helix transcriptional regulator
MPTTSLDIPSVLYQYIETEVKEGQYESKAEAIRSMIRKEMERKHSVDERLSDETLEKIEQARERGAVEGDIRELIEDLGRQ